ncbi:unknown [Clostridium sp. CAG:609]|nr:unknown [Clostridium sp. CAG:609]
MELEQTKIHTLWGDKMNNKGSTLLELIISIALISVILVFMVRLLVDLNDSETNNKYAKKNQVIRAEILRTIENDLQNKIITDIRDNSTTSNLIITFKFDGNKESNINVLKDKLTYKNTDGKTRTWTLKEGYFDITQSPVDFSQDENIYSLIIDIPVYTTNEFNTKNNNNLLDDILVSYIGRTIDLNTFSRCYGKGCSY